MRKVNISPQMYNFVTKKQWERFFLLRKITIKTMIWEYKKAQMLIIQESRRCFWGLVSLSNEAMGNEAMGNNRKRNRQWGRFFLPRKISIITMNC